MYRACVCGKGGRVSELGNPQSKLFFMAWKGGGGEQERRVGQLAPGQGRGPGNNLHVCSQGVGGSLCG